MLWERFHSAAQRYPTRPALELPEQTLTYRQFLHLCIQLTGTFRFALGEKPSAIAVLTAVDALSYAALPATLASGNTYVPLSMRVPPTRIQEILSTAGVAAVLLSRETLPAALHLFETIRTPLTLIFPAETWDDSVSRTFRNRRLQHRCLPVQPALETDVHFRASTGEDSPAYILFTSGSTGEQKGVPISRPNLSAYLNSYTQLLKIFPEDRCTQANNLSFDLSIHDMLVTWISGACLVPIPEQYRGAAYTYVKDKKLTVWLSTPYVARQLLSHAGPQPRLAELRLMMLAGEAFPLPLAQSLQQLAPQCRIWNLYGPTEATIVVFGYEFIEPDTEMLEYGFLPLGEAFPEHRFKISAAPENSDPQQGELFISGPQIFSGYIEKNPPTRQCESAENWYATGDLVQASSSGRLYFCGRVDRAVKVRGCRVDLSAVETALQSVLPGSHAAVLAWPLQTRSAEHLYAFVQAKSGSIREGEILNSLRTVLPPAMLPSRIFSLEDFPQTLSGKVDYRALEGQLAQTIDETTIDETTLDE
jgi:amino acid adenylation domain-containing protein